MPAGQAHIDTSDQHSNPTLPRVRDAAVTRMAQQLRERFGTWAAQASRPKTTIPFSKSTSDDLIDPALLALSAGPAVAPAHPTFDQTAKPAEAQGTALSRESSFSSNSSSDSRPSLARLTPATASTLQPGSDALEDKMPAPVVPLMDSKVGSNQPASQVSTADTAALQNPKAFESCGPDFSSLPSLPANVYDRYQSLPAYKKPRLASEINLTPTNYSTNITKPPLNINHIVKEKTTLCSNVDCFEAEPHSEHRFPFRCGVTGCTLDRRFCHQHDESSSTVAPTEIFRRSDRTLSTSERSAATVPYPAYHRSSPSGISIGPLSHANPSIVAIQERGNIGSINSSRRSATTTDNLVDDPDPPCSEHPHLFSGLDSLEALLSLADAPEPVHRGRARLCMNAAAHTFEPQYVCPGCLEQSSRNIKSTKPGLLAPKYLPLCERCARAAEAANEVTSHSSCKCGGGWLCHDCRVHAYEIAQAKKEGEVEWRNGVITEAITNNEEDIVEVSMKCRCGADAVAESAKVLRCAGCEACQWSHR